MRTVKQKINGVEYVAAWKGVKYREQAIEKCTDKKTGRMSSFELAKIVFDEIIIKPKVNIDSFGDNIDDFADVFDFGKSVLLGEIEPYKSKSKLKQEVEEEWGAWRLIFCDMGNFDYDTVFNQMTPQEIKKANIALDIINAQLKKRK